MERVFQRLALFAIELRQVIHRGGLPKAVQSSGCRLGLELERQDRVVREDPFDDLGLDPEVEEFRAQQQEIRSGGRMAWPRVRISQSWTSSQPLSRSCWAAGSSSRPWFRSPAMK